jgi:hypothetical protein
MAIFGCVGCFYFHIPEYEMQDSETSTIKLHADGNITCKTHWIRLKFGLVTSFRFSSAEIRYD